MLKNDKPRRFLLLIFACAIATVTTACSDQAEESKPSTNANIITPIDTSCGASSCVR